MQWLKKVLTKTAFKEDKTPSLDLMVVEADLAVERVRDGEAGMAISKEEDVMLTATFHHNEKHRLHWAVGNTDIQPIGGQDQSIHAWC